MFPEWELQRANLEGQILCLIESTTKMLTLEDRTARE